MTGHPAGRADLDLLAAAAAATTVASGRAGIAVRPLESLEQMQAACEVLSTVWDIQPGDAIDVQPHLLRALGHGGNYLVGAYRLGSSEMVGASVAFFIEPLGAALHSHITGVLPGTTRRGVGAAMKWHQRQWALERGLSRITWTYDPLIARNSFFNLTRLGARPENYFIDFYGALNDGPNRGQPTDRAEVVWDLSAASTLAAERSARDSGTAADGSSAFGSSGGGSTDGGSPAGESTDDGFDVTALLRSDPAVALTVGVGGRPLPGTPPGPDDGTVLIQIPPDIEQMRVANPRQALAWRYELRATLSGLMADTSWQVTGFARPGWYMMERRTPVFQPAGGVK